MGDARRAQPRRKRAHPRVTTGRRAWRTRLHTFQKRERRNKNPRGEILFRKALRKRKRHAGARLSVRSAEVPFPGDRRSGLRILLRKASWKRERQPKGRRLQIRLAPPPHHVRTELYRSRPINPNDYDSVWRVPRIVGNCCFFDFRLGFDYILCPYNCRCSIVHIRCFGK